MLDDPQPQPNIMNDALKLAGIGFGGGAIFAGSVFSIYLYRKSENQLQKKLAALQSEYDRVKSEYDTMKSKYEASDEKIQSLKTSLTESQNELANVRNELQTYHRQLNQMQRSHAKTQKSSQLAGGLVATACLIGVIFYVAK
eukprot:CAMPEP_0114678502 /NCGR_PEP_ID=MMETSP0191-20121206/51830_1 /TAXON_ID=126664 /ORGANISM="Sorites sp." /LENGTH=141 /DNA_ID=CAMNT_0001952625 /DNA_START=108 /DNA_END=533 /DNA_ORIENTATION=+